MREQHLELEQRYRRCAWQRRHGHAPVVRRWRGVRRPLIQRAAARAEDEVLTVGDLRPDAHGCCGHRRAPGSRAPRPGAVRAARDRGQLVADVELVGKHTVPPSGGTGGRCAYRDRVVVRVDVRDLVLAVECRGGDAANGRQGAGDRHEVARNGAMGHVVDLDNSRAVRRREGVGSDRRGVTNGCHVVVPATTLDIHLQVRADTGLNQPVQRLPAGQRPADTLVHGCRDAHPAADLLREPRTEPHQVARVPAALVGQRRDVPDDAGFEQQLLEHHEPFCGITLTWTRPSLCTTQKKAKDCSRFCIQSTPQLFVPIEAGFVSDS